MMTDDAKDLHQPSLAEFLRGCSAELLVEMSSPEMQDISIHAMHFELLRRLLVEQERTNVLLEQISRQIADATGKPADQA